MVLEDVKEHKWSENELVITLKFMKDETAHLYLEDQTGSFGQIRVVYDDGGKEWTKYYHIYFL